MTRRREYRIAYAPEPIFEAKPRLRYKQLCRSLTFTTITFRPSRDNPRIEALVQKITGCK
jgi:hypothetical protein